MVWGSARGYRKVFRCLDYHHDVVVRLLVMNTETMQGEGRSRRKIHPFSGIGVLVVG